MLALPVPRPLTHFVRTLRLVTTSSDALYERLPDGETELVLRLGEDASSATLFGARTHMLEKLATGCRQTLLIRFHAAGSYPFFDRPMSELVDQALPLTDLWQRASCSPLEAASDPDELARAAADLLLHRLRRADATEPASVAAVRRAVRTIQESAELPRVSQLAAAVGISERQLRRGFDHVVGVSPKHFLRSVRFRRALRTARRTPNPDWSAIAEGEGYYDQAHLIAEFRALTGTTPVAFRQRAQAATSAAAR